MSSKAWPAGTLSRALAFEHRLDPLATAPQLARRVGCDPGSARMVLRTIGIKVPTEKPQRLIWTADMKQALLEGIKRRRSVEQIAEHIGVSPIALVLGAFELVRDLSTSEQGR